MVRPIQLAFLAGLLATCAAGPATRPRRAAPLVVNDGLTHTADATWAGKAIVVRASKDGRPTTVRVPAGVTIQSCTAEAGGTLLLDGGTLAAGGTATKGGVLRLRGGTVGKELWSVYDGSLVDVDRTTLQIKTLQAESGGTIRLRSTTVPADCKLLVLFATAEMTDVRWLDTRWVALTQATLHMTRCQLEGDWGLHAEDADVFDFNGGSIEERGAASPLILPRSAHVAKASIHVPVLALPAGAELRDCDTVVLYLEAFRGGFGSIRGGRLDFNLLRRPGDTPKVLNLATAAAHPHSLAIQDGTTIRISARDALLFPSVSGPSVMLTGTDFEGQLIECPAVYLSGPRAALTILDRGAESTIHRADFNGLTPLPMEVFRGLRFAHSPPDARAIAVRMILPPLGAVVLVLSLIIVRRLRRAPGARPYLAAFALLACSVSIACGLLWLRNREHLDAWAHRRGHTLTFVQSTAGALRVWSNRNAVISTSAGWTYGHAPIPVYAVGFFPRAVWARSVADVWVIPYWLLCSAGLLPGVAWLTLTARAWLRARREPHACPHCGYDLRASADRCPECGQPATVSV